MKKSLSLLGILAFSLLLFGCPQLLEIFSTTTTTSTTTTILPPLLSEYKSIELSDLPALGANYTLPPGGISTLSDISIVTDSVASGFDYLSYAISKVTDGTALIEPKTVETKFELHVSDEGFLVDDLSPSTTPEYLDFTLKNLDIVLDGELNNLSKFMLAIASGDAPVGLAANSRTGLSTFFYGTSKQTNAKMLLSLYVDFLLTDTDLVSTGKLSGVISASYGTNRICLYNGFNYFYYAVPLVIKLECRPFNNVNADDFTDAINLLSNLGSSLTPQNDWQSICDLIWGNHTEEYYIRLTRIVGNSLGTAVTIGALPVLEDLDVLSFLNSE